MNIDFSQELPSPLDLEVLANLQRQAAVSTFDSRFVLRQLPSELMKTLEPYYYRRMQELCAVDKRFSTTLARAVPADQNLELTIENAMDGYVLDRTLCSIYCDEYTHVQFEAIEGHSRTCSAFKGEGVHPTSGNVGDWGTGDSLLAGSCAFAGHRLRIDCRHCVEMPPREDKRDVFAVTYFCGPLEALPAAWDRCHS